MRVLFFDCIGTVDDIIVLKILGTLMYAVIFTGYTGFLCYNVLYIIW